MFMAKRKANKKREITRIVEYLISGGAYFWSGYLMFFVLDQIFGLNLWWAKLGANITGWIVNYLLQRYWVFNSAELKKHQTEVTSRYIFITLVNFLLDYLIVAALQAVGITPYIGQFISSGFFTIWNYVWYKFWVFPEQFKKNRKQHRGIRPRIAHHPHGHGAYHKVR